MLIFYTLNEDLDTKSPGGGGHLHIEGDGDVPLDRVCFFAVITISTGYLNQPKSASPLEQGI